MQSARLSQIVILSGQILTGWQPNVWFPMNPCLHEPHLKEPWKKYKLLSSSGQMIDWLIDWFTYLFIINLGIDALGIGNTGCILSVLALIDVHASCLATNVSSWAWIASINGQQAFTGFGWVNIVHHLPNFFVCLFVLFLFF